MNAWDCLLPGGCRFFRAAGAALILAIAGSGRCEADDTAGKPPRAPAESLPAKAIFIRNGLEVSGGDAAWRTAGLDEVIPPGAGLRTGPRADADIQLGCGASIKLDEETEVRLPAQAEGEGDVTISRGRVFISVQRPPAEPMLVVFSPAGRAAAGDARFFIEVASNSAIRLAVKDGKALFSCRASALPPIPVSGGQTLRASASGAENPAPAGENDERLFRRVADLHGQVYNMKDVPDPIYIGAAWCENEALMAARLEEVRKAAGDKPRDWAAWRNWGDVLAQMGFYADALAKFEHAARLNPRDSTAVYMAGWMLKDLRRYGESIEKHRLAIDMNPKCWQAMNNLAYILAACPESYYRDGQEALTLIQKAIALSPKAKGDTRAVMLDTLAAVYAELGRFAEAVATQKESLALTTRDRQRVIHEWHLELYEKRLPARIIPPSPHKTADGK